MPLGAWWRKQSTGPRPYSNAGRAPATARCETPPAGSTKADPEIRQEIARLEKAISSGNRELLRAAGGFDKAADRLSLLRKLPDGTPTTACTARRD